MVGHTPMKGGAQMDLMTLIIVFFILISIKEIIKYIKK